MISETEKKSLQISVNYFFIFFGNCLFRLCALLFTDVFIYLTDLIHFASVCGRHREHEAFARRLWCWLSQHGQWTPDRKIWWTQSSSNGQGSCSSKIFIFIFKDLFIFMCMGVLFACVLGTACIQCLWKPEEGSGSPGTGITNSCQPLCGC